MNKPSSALVVPMSAFRAPLARLAALLLEVQSNAILRSACPHIDMRHRMMNIDGHTLDFATCGSLDLGKLARAIGQEFGLSVHAPADSIVRGLAPPAPKVYTCIYHIGKGPNDASAN